MDISKTTSNGDDRRKWIEESFKLDPIVTIMLKGKEYQLEFNNYAVKGILKDTGYNLMSKEPRLAYMHSPEIFGAFLYYGLKTHHPEMTQEEADKLYSLKHYLYVLDRITKAVTLFMPELTEEEKAMVMASEKVPEVVEDPTKPPVPSG